MILLTNPRRLRKIHHRPVRFDLGKNVDLLVHENPEVDPRENAEDVPDLQVLESHDALEARYLQEVGAGPLVGEDPAVVEDLVARGDREAEIDREIETDLEAEVDLEVVREGLTDH